MFWVEVESTSSVFKFCFSLVSPTFWLVLYYLKSAFPWISLNLVSMLFEKSEASRFFGVGIRIAEVC
jgi:hypothetical protein